MAKKKSAKANSEALAHKLVEMGKTLLGLVDLMGLHDVVLPEMFFDEPSRAILGKLPDLKSRMKKKLKEPAAIYTVTEIAMLLKGLGESIMVETDQDKSKALMALADKFRDDLEEALEAAEGKRTSEEIAPTPAKSSAKKTRKAPGTRSSKGTGQIYQFTISLRESNPLIWRRIQIEDCTLDHLHGHIQTAMGWTNSHLHQFEIQGVFYCNPRLMDDSVDCEDSRKIYLSQFIPKGRKRFRIHYEYDFGDGWEHEIVYEGVVADPKGKYPLCVEGEYACPPEDCGGIWGYLDFLNAIHDRKNPNHKEMLEWVGGKFDPDKFSAKVATRSMKIGLPEW